jgi:hypothetical protein
MNQESLGSYRSVTEPAPQIFSTSDTRPADGRTRI